MAAIVAEGEFTAWSQALGRQKRSLKATMRTAKRLARPLPNETISVKRTIQIRTLLVLAITGSLVWAATYLLLLPPYRNRPDLFPWGSPVVDMMLSWIQKEGVLASVHAAAADWENKDRMEVERFIMESLVVQLVGEQNRKGLVVPSGTVIMYYLKFWAAREAGDAAQAHCARLEAASANVRKNWMRAFRARWKVDYGILREPNSHDDGDEAILSRVPSRIADLFPLCQNPTLQGTGAFSETFPLIAHATRVGPRQQQ